MMHSVPDRASNVNLCRHDTSHTLLEHRAPRPRVILRAVNGFVRFDAAGGGDTVTLDREASRRFRWKRSIA
jgi:hypothetical protein